MESRTPILDAHRRFLITALVHDVVRAAPESILDVGCGDGLMMQLLTEARIETRGVDPSARQVARARERGCEASEADARSLAFSDGEFDWVTIRHVLHHLDDPSEAVREAWRVARRGVVLAEPFSELSLDSQKEMARLDELTNELLLQRGHVHHPYSRAGDLASFVPQPAEFEVRSYGRSSFVPEDELRVLVGNAAGEEVLSESQANRLSELASAARERRVTYNGTVAVFAHRA